MRAHVFLMILKHLSFVVTELLGSHFLCSLWATIHMLFCMVKCKWWFLHVPHMLKVKNNAYKLSSSSSPPPPLLALLNSQQKKKLVSHLRPYGSNGLWWHFFMRIIIILAFWNILGVSFSTHSKETYLASFYCILYLKQPAFWRECVDATIIFTSASPLYLKRWLLDKKNRYKHPYSEKQV